MICGGVPVGGAVFAPGLTIAPGGLPSSRSPDFSYWQAGTRTQWNPHPNLDIGLEVLYTKLNTAYKGALIAPGFNPGLPQTLVFALEDQDVWSAFFRWQRKILTHDRLIRTIIASTSRPPAGNRRGFLYVTHSSEASCRASKLPAAAVG